MNFSEIHLLAQALAAPFAVEEVHFKPGALSKDKSKALALAYIDARTVMNRLDQVLGIDGCEAAGRDGAVRGKG
jgi:hypothetical protein